ncbi:lipoprotein insertase outer membrane protein LolB [Massilia sp. S19_KUP03_FR1]|uniref:lipoprotein insertase outer membrane protein LolB n=1 Tax=Massilia sp. S19_KUP03_FR1 TaxID=3025503 RepID=UPI002FCD93F2
MIRRVFALAACAAVLAGCAITPSGPLSQAPVAAYRETINLAGTMSVTYQKDGQPQPLTGKFDWQQTPGRVEVSLASPLGQTMATIVVTPESATLTQAERAPRVAKDLETLTHDALGWPLPVSGLRDWLQGYATGADGKRFIASPANNTVVTKDGWRLRFVTWQDDTAAVPQPKRIDADREDLAIRFAIQTQ